MCHILFFFANSYATTHNQLRLIHVLDFNSCIMLVLTKYFNLQNKIIIYLQLSTSIYFVQNISYIGVSVFMKEKILSLVVTIKCWD